MLPKQFLIARADHNRRNTRPLQQPIKGDPPHRLRGLPCDRLVIFASFEWRRDRHGSSRRSRPCAGADFS
jgi:hypothetical protein